MSIINFTVSGGLYTNDFDDYVGDIGSQPLTGTIKFTPEFPKRNAALAVGYDPPSAIVPREFNYVIDIDGVLKPVRGGTDGVRLWANDPVLRLATLAYRITFDVSDLVGNPVPIPASTFWAPSVDKIMYLTSLLGIPGVKGTTGLDRWIDGGNATSTSAEQADGGGL